MMNVLCDVRSRCWLWQTDSAALQYGAFMFRGRKTRAHRVAWFMATGHWPVTEEHVLHKCPGGGRRDCVNPEHLYLGGPVENTRDKLAHGRNNPPIGERARHAKLTTVDIPAIRARRAAGETLISIAADYPIGLSAVHAIATRQSWRHVP